MEEALNDLTLKYISHYRNIDLTDQDRSDCFRSRPISSFYFYLTDLGKLEHSYR